MLKVAVKLWRNIEWCHESFDYAAGQAAVALFLHIVGLYKHPRILVGEGFLSGVVQMTKLKTIIQLTFQRNSFWSTVLCPFLAFQLPSFDFFCFSFSPSQQQRQRQRSRRLQDDRLIVDKDVQTKECSELVEKSLKGISCGFPLRYFSTECDRNFQALTRQATPRTCLA